MKLKVQSSKLKTSANAQAQNALGGYGLKGLTLEFVLSFELWSLNFART